MVTQPAAGGKSPPRSDRPAGFGRGHRADRETGGWVLRKR